MKDTRFQTRFQLEPWFHELADTLHLGVIQICGSLTFKAAGQVRNIAIIIISISIFGDSVTVQQACGYAINVLGFVLYQVVKAKEDVKNIQRDHSQGGVKQPLIHKAASGGDMESSPSEKAEAASGKGAVQGMTLFRNEPRL